MGEKTRYEIFLSYGSPYTPEQQSFISAVKNRLSSRDCETYTVGQDNYSVRQPIQFARDRIVECDGMVVIAFERVRVDKGRDKPGSSEEKLLDDRSLPTVWNHLEAAMGYAHDLPLLILVASGLHREGMLSDRLEWYAQEVELKPDYLETNQFNQTFNDWLRYVDKRKANRHMTKIVPTDIKIGELITALTPSQFWGLIVAAVTAIVAIFSCGFEVSNYLNKP